LEEGVHGLGDETPDSLRDFEDAAWANFRIVGLYLRLPYSTYFWTAKPLMRSNLLLFFSKL